MNKFYGLFFAVMMVFANGVTSAEETIRLGIMPFNSALALIKTHQPLRQHLELVVGQKIEIYTSADYYTFINELLAGHFDVAIAGPHFARMAIEKGWVPLYKYSAELQPIVVVAKNSQIHQLSDLKNKSIGLSSRLSMSSIGGVRWMEERGLKLDRDFKLTERVTHGAAVAAVAVGELDAALTTFTPLKQVPPDVQEKIKVLPFDLKVPHLMTIAHPRLGPHKIALIQRALRSFQNSDAGKVFFDSTGYVGYAEITVKDVQALKPYVDLTVQMMKVGQ